MKPQIMWAVVCKDDSIGILSNSEWGIKDAFERIPDKINNRIVKVQVSEVPESHLHNTGADKGKL